MDAEHELDYGRLKRCSLFGGITEHAFDTLRPHLKYIRFDAGTAIVTEGSLNDRIYFIESGSVEIVKRTHGGLDAPVRRLTTMGPGDTFGEMELIDIQPCAATVRSLEPTETLSLSNHDLYRVSQVDMKTYALIVMNLARDISRRLRHMDDLFAGMTDE
ncbi:MAG: cyclic nucleotide-binding domain-containing protein [Spirochaetaceae bacterium]|nr:MAG: cyclic nucleotide-binding domain-containing protein [Spirochaetaceae bacterium]